MKNKKNCKTHKKLVVDHIYDILCKHSFHDRSLSVLSIHPDNRVEILIDENCILAFLGVQKITLSPETQKTSIVVYDEVVCLESELKQIDNGLYSFLIKHDEGSLQIHFKDIYYYSCLDRTINNQWIPHNCKTY